MGCLEVDGVVAAEDGVVDVRHVCGADGENVSLRENQSVEFCRKRRIFGFQNKLPFPSHVVVS